MNHKMKNKLFKYIIFAGLSLTTFSCGEDYLDQTPLTSITLDSYYKTADQITAATGILYNVPWFQFHQKNFLHMGDGNGGNSLSNDADARPFITYSVDATTPQLITDWKAFYSVINYANSIINFMPERAAKNNVAQSAIDYGMAEARFTRALGYFYLVKYWGAVPIVIDAAETINEGGNLSRNKEEDVYKLIELDLKFAEEKGAPNKRTDGRVSKWTAKALLAKVYLQQKKYAEALAKADEVISSGQFALQTNFADNFKALKNNGIESIYALQWNVASWQTQNTHQAFLSPWAQNITEVGDGWGSYTPTIDLVRAFEANDLRKKATIMTPGDFYPELVSKTNPKGYTYPATSRITGSSASWRKGLVGSPPANGGTDGPVTFMSTSLNTNIIRFSDMYLTGVEAILAGGNSTTNAKALEYINVIRKRAGLPLKVGQVSLDELIQERRIEFAGECDHWFTLLRIPRDKAINIISNQERGTINGAVNGPVTPARATITLEDFILPIPQSEINLSPKLKDEPVAFDFSKLK
jgi:starch-binding outer membrane protein, SusD/RagB family